jgi:hypothetical protein
MLTRTVFVSKLIGLYCILISLVMFAHRQAMIDAVTALVNDPALLLILGVMVSAAGLAIVLSHNVWSGGPFSILVTVLGWLALIKGLLFLSLSPPAAAGVYVGTFHYEQYFYFYAAITLILGLYLTYGGFRSALAMDRGA